MWSATDLAAYGFSSAIEIQDGTGAVISRFALNLPSIAVARAAAARAARSGRCRASR